MSMTGAFRRLGRGAISGFYYYCHHSHHECCCYFVVHVIAIAAPPTNMNYAYCSGNMSSSVHTHSCRLARGEAKAPYAAAAGTRRRSIGLFWALAEAYENAKQASQKSRRPILPARATFGAWLSPEPGVWGKLVLTSRYWPQADFQCFFRSHGSQKLPNTI